jgi:transcriptional regulator GlxA family with amidase domain
MQALVLLVRDADPGDGRHATAEAAERHVELAERWLESHWMSPLRIADLVALGRLGRSQLLARFAARNGRSVGATLLAIRIREAQRLLRAGDASLVEIALACGFGSQSHFCHRFRAATGTSPGAWRERHRGI